MQDRIEQNALELLHAIREHHPDIYAGAWVNPYTAALEAGLDPDSIHYTVDGTHRMSTPIPTGEFCSSVSDEGELISVT
jgi:hypothetical protein